MLRSHAVEGTGNISSKRRSLVMVYPRLKSSLYIYIGITYKKASYSQLISLDFSLSVKAATLIFISGRGSAISSAKEGKSGSIYNLVKN